MMLKSYYRKIEYITWAEDNSKLLNIELSGEEICSKIYPAALPYSFTSNKIHKKLNDIKVGKAADPR